MRLILPGLALLLLTACGLKDDLYLADSTPSQQAPPELSGTELDESGREQDEDDATNP